MGAAAVLELLLWATFPCCSLVDVGQDPALGWGIRYPHWYKQAGTHAPQLALSLWDPASQVLLSPLLLLTNTGRSGSNQGRFLLPCVCCHFWTRSCTTFPGKIFSLHPNWNLWPLPLVPSPFGVSLQRTAPGSRAGWR